MKYDEFCSDNNIAQSQKVNILNSEEIKEFGAMLVDNFAISYIRGISTGYIAQSIKQDFKHGFIKIPLLDHKPTFREKVNLGLKGFMSKAWATDGFMNNFGLTLFHYSLIIIIPIVILGYHSWVLISTTLFPKDIESKTWTVQDIINPSSYKPWYNEVPVPQSLFITMGICGGYFIVSLIELVSFYATDLMNTGKYRTEKTRCKQIQVTIYWVFFAIFAVIYAMLLTLFLVWCILGAILNPTAFLPYAAGAGTFILFVKSKYDKLKKLDETLKEIVFEFVQTKLQSKMGNSLTKVGINSSDDD